MPLAGFYPSWRNQVFPVARIDWPMFDVVATGFVLPRPDGALDTDSVEPYLAELVAQAHAHNNQVVVAIGGAKGYGDAFQQISIDPVKRARFVANVARLVNQYGLDGIDIDWEYWTWQQHNQGGRDPAESPLLVTLLAALRAGLPRHVKLSVDIVPGDWTGSQYVAAIQNHVDHVNLMAFDFTGAWDSSSVGHHAPVKMVGKAVEWAAENGFDLGKLWLGEPVYGIEFADGTVRSAAHVPYADIAMRLKDDPQALRRGRLGQLYFDSNTASVEKAEMAVERNLSGVFMFELTSDTTQRERSVRHAARVGLGARACSRAD